MTEPKKTKLTKLDKILKQVRFEDDINDVSHTLSGFATILNNL